MPRSMESNPFIMASSDLPTSGKTIEVRPRLNITVPTLERFFYRKATSSPDRVAKPRTYFPISAAPPKTAFPAEAAVALATLVVDEAFAALVDEEATVVVAFAGFTEEEVVTVTAPENTVDLAVVVLETLVVEDDTVTREDDVCFLD